MTDDSQAPWRIVFSQQHELDFQNRQQDEPDGRILHIFRKANFSRLSVIDGCENHPQTWLTRPEYVIDDLFYDRIKPALILATRLIDNSRSFFDKVFNNRLISDGQKIAIDQDDTSKASMRNYWNDTVLDQISNFQIYTGRHLQHDGSKLATIYYGQYPTNSSAPIQTCALQLYTEWTAFFLDPSFDQWPAEKKNRIIFMLAVVISHEISHLCWRFRWHMCRKNVLPMPVDEPQFRKSDPMAELGFSWEQEALGGLVQRRHTNVDSHGDSYADVDAIGTYDMSGSSTGTPPRNALFKVIDDRDVAAFFDSRCWTIFESIRGGKTHLPIAMAGNNLLENMRTARFINEYKALYGQMPPIAAIRIAPPREERFPLRSRRVKCHARNLLAASASDQAQAQRSSQSAAPAAFAASSRTASPTFAESWRSLAKSRQYRDAINNEGAPRR